MSMDFSDFKRLLGADPRSRDPDFLRARDASPECSAAAAEAERFEAQLERALSLPEPPGLIDALRTAARQGHAPARKRWWPAALAAGLLLAITAAGLSWRASHRWDSVEQYVVDHYYHDGVDMLADAGTGRLPPVQAADLQALFAGFEAQAAPAFAKLVGVVKVCVTPDGDGIHMVLDTENGLVTVIYMPNTGVEDRQSFEFDGQQAVLVQLQHGSAAIVSSGQRNAGALYALVQDSILPLPGSS
jgi:Protein of unknown function (DUF3379)